MTSPTRVLIHGANGRMGQALLRLAADSPGLRVVAAVTRLGDSAGAGDTPFFASADLAAVPPFDVAIDFSLPEAFDAILALCRSRHVGLVSGTTGLSSLQRQAMTEAGSEIPVLWASNFSLGVAVLEDLVRRAAKVLADWDADLVESHHVHKKDAPSGTALTLGRAVAEGRGAEPNYMSLRAGDIVGEHTVQFTGQGERLELIHRASNRDIFARGALSASLRLSGRSAGSYELADLIFSS